MPFAPSERYRGDQYIFQAISGLGEDVSKAIKKYRSDREESQFLDTQIEGLIKASTPYAKQGLIDPKEAAGELDKIGSLSLSQKRAKAATMAFQLNQLGKQADDLRQSQRDKSLEDYRNQTLALQRGTQQRQESRETANSGFVSGLGGVFGAADPSVRDANLAYLFQTNPGVDPEVVSQIFRGITSMDASRMNSELSDPSKMIRPFDVGGRTGIVNRRTGQMAIDSTPESQPEPKPLRTTVRVDNQTGAVTKTYSGTKDQVDQVLGPGAVHPSDSSKVPKLSDEEELRIAMKAISNGKLRSSVARVYKERTGKDLPE